MKEQKRRYGTMYHAGRTGYSTEQRGYVIIKKRNTTVELQR
jgi:hypothetical protein